MKFSSNNFKSFHLIFVHNRLLLVGSHMCKIFVGLYDKFFTINEEIRFPNEVFKPFLSGRRIFTASIIYTRHGSFSQSDNR